MKIKTIVLMAFLCCFVGSVYAQDIVTKTHEAENLKSIAVSGNVDIYITQGSGTTVKIEATEKQHKDMELEIKNGGLSVAYKGKGKAIKVYANVSTLKSLAASSGADVVLENEIKSDKLALALSSGSDFEGALNVDELSCAASSGSDINLKSSKVKKLKMAASSGSDLTAKKLTVGTCNLAISGGSDVDIAGSCDDMNLVTSGGSDFSANNFEIKNCNLVVSGGSDTDIHVTGELSVVVSGSSDVTCKGNPTVKSKKVSKSSDFSL